MSTLFVDELFNGITFTQKFKITKSTDLAHIRPWIYKQGVLQDGVLTCEVWQGSNLLTTSTVDYTEINTGIPEAFAHGYIRMDFPNLVLNVEEGQEETEYTLKLYMDNHVSNSSNFIAVVREWDDQKWDSYGDVDINNEPVNDTIAPAGLEFFEYRST